MERDRQYTVIPNYDPASLWWALFQRARGHDAEVATYVSLLEQTVDEHAWAGIDHLVHSVFEGFRSPQLSCSAADPHGVGDHPIVHKQAWVTEILRALDAAGFDLIQVLLERCHGKKMQFLAGLRMNDRHAGSGQNSKFRPRVQRMIDAHPEWALKEFPGGLNYRYEGVRDAVLAFIAETLDKYDVDGIEFDWMRWCHVFEASEAVDNAPLLTDFTRRTRALLDAAGDKWGRPAEKRLLLGARVPHTIEECTCLGYDIDAWVRDDLVDYIAPTDFFYIDVNMRTEDLVALTEAAGSRCKVYPSIHPGVCWEDSAVRNTVASYRAAARNFYAHGAHGVSPYNYQSHWGSLSQTDPDTAQGLREPLGWLTALRSDQSIAAGDRHYLFWPLWWAGDTEGHGVTGAYANDRIILDCTRDDPCGAFSFRMAEDVAEGNLAATLAFKVTHMIEADALEVRVNGQPIASTQIEREWSVGRPRSQGRAKRNPQRHSRVSETVW